MKVRLAWRWAAVPIVLGASIALTAAASTNLPICTAAFDQYTPKIVSDGDNGAIIVWDDGRSGAAGFDVYAQRIDRFGLISWTNNGVLACGESNDQYLPTAASDGLGGAVVAWRDERDGNGVDVYAQRITSTGSLAWGSSAIAVCTLQVSIGEIRTITDGNGGAIVLWEDNRNGIDFSIFAQRVDSNGSTRWTDQGETVSTFAGNQAQLEGVSDGDGGAVIVWQQAGTDIFAQRIDSNGTTIWSPSGVAVCAAPQIQGHPDLVPRPRGGATICWGDLRNSGTSGEDIYAQRIDGSGASQWNTNGVVVCDTSDTQTRAKVALGSGESVIVAWADFRAPYPNDNIYAQRIDSTGNPVWAVNGVSVSTDSAIADYPQVVPDGKGGAIITWQDHRAGVVDPDIYAQRVDSTGVALWTSYGTKVSGAPESQWAPQVVASAPGRALITWEDWRNGGPLTNHDIYAQRVMEDGSLDTTTGIPQQTPQPSHISFLRSYPNPFGSITRIEFYVVSDAVVTVTLFDIVGRRVGEETVTASRGVNYYELSAIPDGGRALPTGIYLVRLEAFGTIVSSKVTIVR